MQDFFVQKLLKVLGLFQNSLVYKMIKFRFFFFFLVFLTGLKRCSISSSLFSLSVHVMDR